MTESEALLFNLSDKSELKNLLSQLSGIPEEHLEYVKMQVRDTVSVLQIHDKLQWTSTPVQPEDYTSNLQDGNVVYYR